MGPLEAVPKIPLYHLPAARHTYNPDYSIRSSSLCLGRILRNIHLIISL